MKITVDSGKVIRKWPRVEAYQNSTLRYSPPPDFPAYAASKIGKPKIMRCWVTLDEIWDYRTGEYEWDYAIGVNRYAEDKQHYRYDWCSTVPNGTHFQDYLTSHAAEAEEVLLNIRRYEREVSDGIITYEKYGEVVEAVVAHCKKLCPNIVYIECGNEVELGSFGAMTTEEYVKIYKITAAVVKKLNEQNQYSLPLKIGGYAMSGCMSRWNEWQDFLLAIAADPVPIDFYSMHDYNPNIYRLLDFTNRHRETVERLGLPDVPLFINEYGVCGCTSVPTDSLKNASGVIAGMILGSHLKEAHPFPWCTFHNPKLQLSYTEFVRLDDGTYAPTPNGNAIIALHMLEENEIAIVQNTEYKAVATKGNGRIVLLFTNPSDEPLDLDITVIGEFSYKVKLTQYLCDSTHNNRVTGELVTDFVPTSCGYVSTTDRNHFGMKMTLEPRAFELLIIE